jgi:hypothetical protein
MCICLLNIAQVWNNALTDESDRFQYLLLGHPSPLNPQQKMVRPEALAIEAQLLHTVIWAPDDEPLIA